MNSCMEASLSSTALDGLISHSKAFNNFLRQVTAIFCGVYFEYIVSTKFFGFI